MAKEKLQAFHVEYVDKFGSKIKRFVICKNIKALNKTVLELQNKGCIIKKVTNVTYK